MLGDARGNLAIFKIAVKCFYGMIRRFYGYSIGDDDWQNGRVDVWTRGLLYGLGTKLAPQRENYRMFCRGAVTIHG